MPQEYTYINPGAETATAYPDWATGGQATHMAFVSSIEGPSEAANYNSLPVATAGISNRFPENREEQSGGGAFV